MTAPVPTASSLEAKLRAALAPHLVLVRQLGAGGMGTVFLAREPALKRTVAVKVLAPDLARSPESRARFEREAQAVAGLSHPNVVAVHGVGELADGTPYFVMQYVPGRSIAERLVEEGPLAVPEARRILGEVASALAAAHAKGIIHRDIKPANILCDDDSGRALVSDFGIVAVMPREGTGAGDVRLTQTGMLVGTPQYMSPEQLLNEPVTEKTDVYALGLLGYEMLAGAAPFQATTPHELIAAHLRDTPKSLSTVRDDVDAETESLIAGCLAKSASQRPGAATLARQLTPGAAAPLEWPPPGLEALCGRAPALARRFAAGSALVSLVLLALFLRGSGISSAMESGATQMLLLAGVIGLVVIAAAAVRLARDGLALSRAARGGFAWGTLLETVADGRGDTGHLIAGSRQFAALPAERRSTLRAFRVARALLLLAASMMPPPLFLLIAWLGAAGLAGAPASLAAVLVPVAMVVAAYQLRRAEAGLIERRAGRRPHPKVDVARLAGPWYESFENVRAGQTLGRGLRDDGRSGKVGTAVVVLVIAVAVVAAVPLIAIGTFGPRLADITIPAFMNTRDKWMLAQITRPFAIAKDSSITTAAAGRAYAEIQGPVTNGEFVGVPVPEPLPLPWDSELPAGLFPSARPREFNGPHSLAILEAARRGFSPAEMAYLERVAHAWVWKPVGIVARAPRLDVLGSRFVVPFPEHATRAGMPILRYARSKGLAYANTSRAAWYLATGHRDSAEIALKETIGFGFALTDNATTLIDALIGVVIVGIGRENLIQLYGITGNPAGRALAARRDSARSALENRIATRNEANTLASGVSQRATRSLILRTAGQPSEIRALQWEMLSALSIMPCTNAREVVFGIDRDARQVFAAARKDLARYPSEVALIDMMETTPERMAYEFGNPTRLVPRLAVGFGRLSSRLLANQRIAGCVNVLTQVGVFSMAE